jgi:hypothetical protein
MMPMRVTWSIVPFSYSSRSSRGFGWRIHCGVEVTELSTKKQHTLPKLPQIPKTLIYASSRSYPTNATNANCFRIGTAVVNTHQFSKFPTCEPPEYSTERPFHQEEQEDLFVFNDTIEGP